MSSAEETDAPSSPDRVIGRIVRGSEFVMETLELLTGVVLIILFAIGLYDLIVQIWTTREALFTDIDNVIAFIDTVLLLLVIVEVFRTVVAFSRDETITRIIIDASLVAIARKVIGFRSTGTPVEVLINALAIAVLLLAVIAAFYVVRRVTETSDDGAGMPAAGTVDLGTGNEGSSASGEGSNSEQASDTRRPEDG